MPSLKDATWGMCLIAFVIVGLVVFGFWLYFRLTNPKTDVSEDEMLWRNLEKWRKERQERKDQDPPEGGR